MAEIIKLSQKGFARPVLTRLDSLDEWIINGKGIVCKREYPFCFKYFDISIGNREVTHWMQPLSVANGKALFALAYIIVKSTMLFIIKIHKEIGCEFGSCFAPTIQLEAPYYESDFNNDIEKQVFDNIQNGKCLINTTLSK